MGEGRGAGHHGTLPPPLGSLDMSGIILTTGTFWLRTTLLYNYTINTHYTASTLSGFQNILSLLLHPLPPPPPPHLALHTKLFPTILRHEFISITKENTYQIVFVSLMYFSFSNLPIRRLDRQEKPFLTGPALHVWRTFGSEGEEIFDVMFHSEAQYENHDSKVTVNHLITRP